jgi:hypothetical protein
VVVDAACDDRRPSSPLGTVSARAPFIDLAPERARSRRPNEAKAEDIVAAIDVHGIAFGRAGRANKRGPTIPYVVGHAACVG